MAITKEKKKEVVGVISDALDNSGSVTFVNFKGIGVEDMTRMRNLLREKGVGYYVAKKTLIRRALDEKNFEGEVPELEGEIALAYSEDPTASAREIHDFGKEVDGTLMIVGGVFEKSFQDKAAMTEIALIPSRETLLAQFVNVINSPIQGLAVALNQIAESKS